MAKFYFYASDEDIYNIFEAIEDEFDIKYCVKRTHSNLDYKPTLEFYSIRDLELTEMDYLITKKNQIMDTVYRRAYGFYENDYRKHKDSVLFYGRKLYPHNQMSDYCLHIDLNYWGLKSDFAEMLFKRIVKEVKRNCIKIDYHLFSYMGKELYKNKKDYIFCGQNNYWDTVFTDSGASERWWWNEEVRLFMKKPFDEQFEFFTKVLSNDVISDYDGEFENQTANYQIYEAVFSKLHSIEDLDFLKKLLPLFNDNSNALSPFAAATKAMETLYEMVMELAYLHKAEGITYLLKHLYLIPDTGYHCGSLTIVKALLYKKYIGFFKQSLPELSQEDKERLKAILHDVPPQRIAKARDMILKMLNS